MKRIANIFKDKHGKLAVFQMPNAPLIIWGVAAVLTHVLHQTQLRQASGAVAFIALIFWAGWEVMAGSSLFRRVLGFVVLIASLVNKL